MVSKNTKRAFNAMMQIGKTGVAKIEAAWRN